MAVCTTCGCAGSQQRERRPIENLRESSFQGVADKFSADAGGARIEVGQQRIPQAVERLTRPRRVAAYQPQSPEAANQEIISRRGEPRTEADEMTSGFKHLGCIPTSERLVHGATDRLSVWQLVETADTPVQPECLAGVSDGLGLNIA